MKIKHILTASILALSTVSLSQAAEVVLHVTGSTAFRKAFVQSVEDQMNGSGAYTVAYKGSTPTTAGSETGANDVVLRGTINGQACTVKCTWTGSIGGIIAVAKQVAIANIPGGDGWMSITNLPTSGSTAGGALVNGNQTLLAVVSPSLTLDAGTFATETQNADLAMSDSFQASSVLFAKPVISAAVSGKEIVGVVPFEWVANNGAQTSLQTTLTGGATTSGSATITVASTAGVNVNAEITGTGIPTGAHVVTVVNGTTLTLSANATATGSGLSFTHYFASPITSINGNQANGLLSGGKFLSEFTGNNADSSTFVYAMGRNYDSGTRLAAVSETSPSIGATGTVSQLIAGGTAGVAGGITTLDLYPAETLYAATGFPVSFPLGTSGFSSGGTLAGWIAAPGSFGASPANGATAPLFDGLGNEGGWLIAYLGRNDANTAVTATAGPNTAHRLLWNGAADWPAATGAAAVLPVTGYVDSAVEEGVYSFWEYEHLLAKQGGLTTTAGASQQAVANGIYTQMTGVVVSGDHLFGSADAPLSGILSGAMNVAKTVEGGPISHN